jgi:hypothetical protein
VTVAVEPVTDVELKVLATSSVTATSPAPVG